MSFDTIVVRGTLLPIARSSVGLARARDLEFDPENPARIVNRGGGVSAVLGASRTTSARSGTSCC